MKCRWKPTNDSLPGYQVKALGIDAGVRDGRLKTKMEDRPQGRFCSP